MNRIYRLVFNRVLRVWQVASELVRSRGGVATRGSGGGAVVATVPRLRFALWLSLGWVVLVPTAMAQHAPVQPAGRIISDPDAPGTRRPTVLQAPNGAPLVNIATPSAAGVSRNAYRQFDVGPDGAILNNARTAVQTELGGRVQGNPWLAGGTARIILNEVNSAAPSHLHGYVEVAGDRAQVVIANPAGIQVDGGGFLNASRVTLSTGAPVFEGDALAGYRVEGGTIRIVGNGLDATRTDYTGLIARAMEVNAGIWAQQLQAAAGVNSVSADLSQVHAVAGTASGPAPTLAIDVSALGGMYAGKITLLGTEQGVGVRNAGTIGAQAGELTVTVDGRLENTGAMQSREDTRVAATGGVVSAGTLSATRELAIVTPQALDNSGGTLNAARIQVDAGALRNRAGAIEQTGLQSLAIRAGDVSNRDGGRIGIAEPGTDVGGAPGSGGSPGGGNPDGSGGSGGTPDGGQGGGTIPLPVPLAPGALHIAGTLDNDGGRINAGGGIDLGSANGLDNDAGQLAVRRLEIHGGDLGNRGGSISVSGATTVSANRVDNTAGRIEAAGTLALEARAVDNRGGTFVHSGTAPTALHVDGVLDNAGGVLASNASAVELAAGVLVNEDGQVVHSGEAGLRVAADTLHGAGGRIATAGSATLHAGHIDHRGATLSATQLEVSARSIDNRAGHVIASGDGASRIAVDRRLDNDGGTISTTGDLDVRAADFGNAGGRVQHAGEGALSIAVGTLHGDGGTLASNGTLALTGDTLDLRDGQTQARSIGIVGGDLTTAGGRLVAGGDGALRLHLRGALDNDGGSIATNGALDLGAGSASNRGGAIQAAGDARTDIVVEGMLDNTDGLLATAGDTGIVSAELRNTGGTLQAADRLQLSVEGLLDNSDDGLMAAGGDMTFAADVLANTGGTIQHAGEGTLAIDARRLDGEGGTIAGNGSLALRGESVNLRDGLTQARRIAVEGGDLTTAGGRLVATGDEALRLQLRGRLDNDGGAIATNGALDLSAGAASNRAGAIQAAGDAATRIRIAGTLDNAGGLVAATGDTTIAAAALLNTGGVVQAAGESTLQVGVDGLLDNSAGLVVAGGDMTVAAGTLDNTGGAIQHAGEGMLAIDAGALDGTGGTIVGNGSLALRGGVLDLRDGTTQARTIVVEAGDLTTAGGSLVASGGDTLRLRLQGALDNDGGTIATNGALDLTAAAASSRGGTLQAAGAAHTAMRVATTFDNTGGILAAAGNTTVAAGELLNVGGVLRAAEDATLAVSVDGLLDNSSRGLIAAGGDVTLAADVLANTDGVVQHAGDGTLAIDARILEGAGGTIAGNGALRLHGDLLNLRDGTTHAQTIEVEGGDLTTAGGRLIATGDEVLRLQLRGTLDNNVGTIATNGTLDLTAGAASNRGGTVQAAGDGTTRVRVTSTFDNTGGVLAAAGDTTVDAGRLVNAGGLLQAAGDSTLQLDVAGLLDNSAGGLITAGGDTTIGADVLDNAGGAIQHAGDGTLNIATRVLDGVGGTITGNGSLALRGDVLDLRDGATQARDIVVEAGDLTTAGGSLVAIGEQALRLQLRGSLDNAGGTIATNGALDLAAAAASNRAGSIQAAGGGDARMRIRGSLDNTDGLLAFAGATVLEAGELRNGSGVLQVVGESTLSVSADGLLDNSADGLIAAGGDTHLSANVLDNTGGTIQHAGAGTLAVDTRVLDGTGGSLLGNGTLRLTGEVLNLRDGLTRAQTIAVTGGDLATAGGSLVATGDEALRLQLHGTLDNDGGTIATNGALDLAAGAARNRGGTIQAAGDGTTQVRVTSTFDNTGGVLAAAGDTTVDAGRLVNAGGLLQAAGDSTLQLDVAGLLDNSAGGLITVGGDTTITADTLDNTGGSIQHAGDGTLAIDARVLDGAGGTLAGNGALAISGDSTNLRGGTTSAHRISIETGTLTTAGGSLVAAGDDTLRLGVRGTFDNAGGTVATNGGLDLGAARFDNRGGTVQVAGNAAAELRVTGTLDNAGGLLATAGATTLRAGEFLNAAGALAATDDAPLQVTVDGRIVNDGGSIESNGNIALQSQSLSNPDGVVRTQQAISATVGALLDNSRGTVVAGGDLSLRAGTLRNQDTHDPAVTAPASQRGLFGNRVVVDAATVDNTRGQINAGNGLTLTGVALANAGGRIDGTRAVDVSVASFVNAGGRLTQRGGSEDLNLDVSGTLDNGGGFVGADGNATLRAGQMDNSAGTVFAGRHLDMASERDLHNRDGGLLQSNAGLTLATGGTFDNSGGSVDARGAATVVVGRLANVGGQLLAGTADQPGSGLDVVSAGEVDNRGGTIGSRGGDLTLHASDIDNRGQGLVVSSRDLALHTQGIDNAGGTVYAGRDLAWQNGSGGVLVNDGGRFGAGNAARLSVGRIYNRDGGRIQADTLWLDAPSLDNAGGEVSANTLHAQLSVLGGAGRIYGAQWLNLHFNGDYTYAAGQRMDADGHFALTVTGTFTNQGTLQSAGELSLTAGNVINDTGGTINASNASGTGVNRITAAGTIENRSGASLEGDTLLLSARDVVNTGDIVGDTVGIDADTLTNGRELGDAMAGRDYGEGFIGAAELLELRIGQRLSNLDGELYSGGDLLIAGRTDGSRVGRLENVSGRIQAERDLDIAADAVVNERRVVVTEHRAYVGSEQFDDPDAGSRTEAGAPGWVYAQFCPDDGRSRCTYFSAYTTYQDRVLEGTRVVATSAAAQLVSGRDMRIDTGSVENRYSQIAAGRNLTISGRTSSDGSDPDGWNGVVNNVALSGYKIIESGGAAEVQYQRCSVEHDCQFEPSFATVELGTQTHRKDVFLLGGSITAGQGVTIVGGGISNTVVGAGDGLASIGPGTVSGPGSTGLGAASGASARRLGNVDASEERAVSGNGPVGTVAAGTVIGGSGLDTVEGESTSGAGSVRGVDGQAVTARVGLDAVAAGTVSGGSGVGAAFGEHVATRAVPEGAATQVVGTPERPLPGLVPPDNGMFDIVADADSPFLVRTAPRFVPGDTTGSDYLLDRLGASSDLHKRLGDAYYEQRLVLEQLMALTGRRSLDGSDGLGQYRSLMDNAAQVADGLGLVLGSPLTVTQIGALDQDIVWLVEQVIDGHTVLVPVVYLSRATAERLRADGALIAGEEMKIRSSSTVRNDGTLEANQGLWLAADTLINDGALRGGNRLDIATAGDTVNRGELIGGSVTLDAGRDVLNSGAITASNGSAVVMAGRDFVQAASGQLSASGDAMVAAGRDLTLQASANAAGGHAVSRIDVGGDLALVAGRDLTLQASKLTSGDNVVLQAGQDLRLEALSSTQTFASNRSSGSVTTHQVVDIRAGGDAALSAGRDALLQGSRVDAEGALALAAGRDVDIRAVVDERSVESQGAVRRGSYQRSEFDQTVRGAELTAGGDIAIVGGRDVTLEAAYVGSEAGGVAIGAGRDLSLIAAEEQHSFEQTTQTKKSGLLSTKRTTTYDRVDETLAVGTTISGETVQMVAGRDITTQAARIVGTGEVQLKAGRDIDIGASENTRHETHSSETRKSGIFGTGGGITWGTQQRTQDTESGDISYTGSVLGSLEGNVAVMASQGTVNVRGSDVAALEGDVVIQGQAVNIEEVRSSSDYRSKETFKQSGLTLAVSVPAMDAAVSAYSSARTVGQSGDTRVNAMAAANAAYDAYQAAGALANAMSGEAVGISLTVGSQQSRNEMTASSSEVAGSSIRAGGQVYIEASGSGEDSNIRISGSDVSGVAGTHLWAENAIDIVAASNTHEQHSENSSSGWNVGVAATYGSSGGAVGITAGVNVGEGYSDGEVVTYINSRVGGGGPTTLTSGGATTIRGGQVVGDRVQVNAAELNIESLQDTETYVSKQMNASAQVTVGYGVSVSGSYSQSDVNASYASVTEQSGILAGDGGYAIHVTRNTDLKGGVITSTGTAETQGNNRFVTGTLTASDIENHAGYTGRALGVRGGVGRNGAGEQAEGWAAQGAADGNPGGTSANKSIGLGRVGDKQSSTTISGINTANIRITDDAGQAASGMTAREMTARIATEVSTPDVSTRSGALENRFDASTIQRELDLQVAVTQAFDQNRQEAKAELYARAQAKADAAREIRMANGGVDTGESKALDKEATALRKTAKWTDMAAMTLLVGPDVSDAMLGLSLTNLDLVRQTATPENKIVLQQCEAGARNCTSREVSRDQIAAMDGQLYVFNNGIFNDEAYALATGAMQNSDTANAAGVYYILNPKTGSWIAELLYAGYDKINDWMNGSLPLPAAAKTNQDLLRQARDEGWTVNAVNHSRGSMTWINALGDLHRQEHSGALPIGSVTFFGAAANSQEAADLAYDLSLGRSFQFQATHASDIVGRWPLLLGGNAATGDKAAGRFPISHSAYTGFLPEIGTPLRELTDRVWGEGNYSKPVLVKPNRHQHTADRDPWE